MILDFDLHNHTPYSRCSQKNYTTAQMLEVMKERGIRHAGFCDHYYLGETDTDAWLAEMHALFARTEGISAYAGVEVDMLAPGVLDANPEDLPKYDYVAIAAPHWHNPRIRRPLRCTREGLAQAAYDMMVSAAALPIADVLVHPFTFSSASAYIDVDQEAIMQEFTEADLRFLAECMQRNGVAVELHANLLKEDYARSMVRFMRLCRDRGVLFSMGSDAHALATVGAVQGAREWIESLRIPDEQRFLPLKHSS